MYDGSFASTVESEAIFRTQESISHWWSCDVIHCENWEVKKMTVGDLVSRKDSNTSVWQYFVVKQDEKGQLVDINYPICTFCMMFMRLRTL